MKLQNVALIGLMRSGKDSVASCLISIFNTEKLSFAAALKDEVADALEYVNDGPAITAETLDIEENKPLYRPLLQWWGTEYRRGQKPDYWVNIVREQVKTDSIRLSHSWVCTDARFHNELSMLQEQGFKIVHLNMDVEELVLYLRGKGMTMQKINEQLDHVTEREWQTYPRDVSFTSRFGNLPQLTRQVVAYLTGEAPTAEVQEKIDTFYAEKYPKLYHAYRKEATPNDP